MGKKNKRNGDVAPCDDSGDGDGGGVEAGGGGAPPSGGQPNFDGATFIGASQNFNASLGEVVGNFATALCQADAEARQANANMIVAMVSTPDGKPRPPIEFASEVTDGQNVISQSSIAVPLVTIANTDAFLPDTAKLEMDMNVSASNEDTSQLQAQAGGEGKASVGWGPFKAQISVHASMSTSKESKRASDYRSTTHAELTMKRIPPPEGLMRIVDSMVKTVEVGLRIQEQKALDAATAAAGKGGVAPAAPVAA